MTKVTSDDYAWFEQRYGGWSEIGYCLTLISDMTANDLLNSLAAQPIGEITGVADLADPSMDAWDTYGGGELVVGAATLPSGWTLMVEDNGFVGVTNSVMERVATGRQIVAHYRNVNAVDRFTWWRDGVVQLSFEPLFASDRDGESPDVLLETMREVGFQVDDSDTDVADVKHTEAAFALAERITGVVLTPDVLDNATFALGRVRLSG